MNKQTKSQILYCISKLQHMVEYSPQNIMMNLALSKHNGILIKIDTTQKELNHKSRKKYIKSSYSLEKSAVKEQCNDRMTQVRTAQYLNNSLRNILKILSIGNNFFWYGLTFSMQQIQCNHQQETVVYFRYICENSRGMYILKKRTYLE